LIGGSGAYGSQSGRNHDPGEQRPRHGGTIPTHADF
jgi:hypothetical protein